jgi:hypothetical protein
MLHIAEKDANSKPDGARNNLITASAASDHHGEMAWLLWVCKQLAIDFDPAAVKAYGQPSMHLDASRSTT